MKSLPALLLALALPVAALAEATPQGGPLDIRIRTAVYNENQVYRIETDLRHSTTIHFGAGERFEAVIVGDTESFQVDPIPELGNVLTIKPHVANASTNMTVITNRRTYSFHLREGSIPNRTGMFFEVRFRYPDEERRAPAASQPKGYEAPRNYNYRVSGDGDFRPLVESLQRQGVRVSVVSTIRSQPPMIADELRRQADNFIELDELREVIGRPPREQQAERNFEVASNGR